MATAPLQGGAPALPNLPAVGLILPEAHVSRSTGLLEPSWPMFRIEGRLHREDIGEAVEQLVRLLDLTAPEQEDVPNFAAPSDGLPGDPDDGEPNADDDAGSWTEWHTRGRHKLARGTSEPFDRTGEDSELIGDETDGSFAEDEEAARFAYMGSGPGCVVADPDKAADDEGENRTWIETIDQRGLATNAMAFAQSDDDAEDDDPREDEH